MSTEVHMHGRIGESIKRKEDGRFLRGKGNYLDDMELPQMLHMAILRSPHAHATIKSIDTAAAGAMPGVIAVVTGELMAQHIRDADNSLIIADLNDHASTSEKEAAHNFVLI